MEKSKKGPVYLYEERVRKINREIKELQDEIDKNRQRNPRFVQGTVEPTQKK